MDMGRIATPSVSYLPVSMQALIYNALGVPPALRALLLRRHLEMKFGFVLPKGDAGLAVEAAILAEEVGWDGFFMWEPVWGVDAWVSLAAVAVRTQNIRLGTLLTPLSRMRPWKLAGEAATLDRLSGGRVILSVGMGAVDTGFEAFGEETDRKTRARLLDEGLEIVTGLWRGQPFVYNGQHYQIRPFDRIVCPPPVQQPRIPIWVVGAWPSKKSMARALRYDGLLPALIGDDGQVTVPTPNDVRDMVSYLKEEGKRSLDYDVIVEGETPGDDIAGAKAIVMEWQEAGATWWIEAMWDKPQEDWMKRVQQGPPRL